MDDALVVNARNTDRIVTLACWVLAVTSGSFWYPPLDCTDVCGSSKRLQEVHLFGPTYGESTKALLLVLISIKGTS